MTQAQVWTIFANSQAYILTSVPKHQYGLSNTSHKKF